MVDIHTSEWSDCVGGWSRVEREGSEKKWKFKSEISSNACFCVCVRESLVLVWWMKIGMEKKGKFMVYNLSCENL